MTTSKIFSINIIYIHIHIHIMFVIIMAGGLGKRMNSVIPKVLHKVNGIPMLVRIISEARLLNPEKILVIVGKYKYAIKKTLKQYFMDNIDDIKFINQEEALGTGHAVQCCKTYLDNKNDTKILILSGDTPLITSSTMTDLLNYDGENKLMTTILDDPFGNGRIYRNELDDFVKIIEEKDCSNEEKKINEVNCGIYVFNKNILCKYISYLDNNNIQNEYYLTDIIQIIKNYGYCVNIYPLPKNRQYELTNINTKEQLDIINDSF